MRNNEPRRVEPKVQIAVTKDGRIIVTCSATAEFSGVTRTSSFAETREFHANNEGEQALEFVRDMTAYCIDEHEKIFAQLETEYHRSLGCAGPLPPPQMEVPQKMVA